MNRKIDKTGGQGNKRDNIIKSVTFEKRCTQDLPAAGQKAIGCKELQGWYLWNSGEPFLVSVKVGSIIEIGECISKKKIKFLKVK